MSKVISARPEADDITMPEQMLDAAKFIGAPIG